MRFHHDANPSWHHLDWSPHWCPDSTSPSQDSSRLQDSVSEGPPLTRGGHRAEVAAGAGTGPTLPNPSKCSCNHKENLTGKN